VDFPEAEVDQALDQPQLLHLFDRVDPLAIRDRAAAAEIVTAFPHAQSFLGHAGVAFDVADRARKVVIFSINHQALAAAFFDGSKGWHRVRVHNAQSHAG
jgi:hypothetical protein